MSITYKTSTHGFFLYMYEGKLAMDFDYDEGFVGFGRDGKPRWIEESGKADRLERELIALRASLPMHPQEAGE